MVEDTPGAREMVLRLIDTASMTPEDISLAMGRRVSRRTVYRWAKGESRPQQSSDLEELQRLYGEKVSAAV